jgi:ankyrin repeat protein
MYMQLLQPVELHASDACCIIKQAFIYLSKINFVNYLKIRHLASETPFSCFLQVFCFLKHLPIGIKLQFHGMVDGHWSERQRSQLNVIVSSLRISFDISVQKGNTALHIASLAGQLEVVKILTGHGSKVNIQSQVSNIESSANEKGADVSTDIAKSEVSLTPLPTV